MDYYVIPMNTTAAVFPYSSFYPPVFVPVPVMQPNFPMPPYYTVPLPPLYPREGGVQG
ncbi:hypothetical protein M569_15862 [Genlisea aurea]|uniref:Uncharacterized protein n=1 Tax=Genlisea aurea TaxID=192259 RepID=S8BWI8_9LAMI|nr:hypothetical protein M569_15862 [Genlisea aurea]